MNGFSKLCSSTSQPKSLQSMSPGAETPPNFSFPSLFLSRQRVPSSHTLVFASLLIPSFFLCLLVNLDLVMGAFLDNYARTFSMEDQPPTNQGKGIRQPVPSQRKHWLHCLPRLGSSSSVSKVMATTYLTSEAGEFLAGT